MSSQQSWAAWLLDSYASSVSPVTSDFPYRHGDTAAAATSESSHPGSSAQSATSLGSNPSPYGPYVRTGRGGAGNFTWQTELKPQRSSSRLDLELQAAPQTSLSERRKAAARLEHINTQEVVRMRQSSAQYLSIGRGGAGNYAASNYEIGQAKRSPSLPISLNSAKAGSPSTSSQSSLHAGRGGAGNYAAAAEFNGRLRSESEDEERRAAELRREQIVEEVDGLLQPPPGAWLGTGRRRSEAAYEDV
ncbi:hypothetical protein A1O3_09755 [Capronia epimyces CBS 606.96]|uniref:Uncharacterized protein n=1 Tax=Capronia epimyces CBS 606.96 TaxID=1182542 RepID=W9XBD9_9EURO|nr:uncharacterized protein A1O3_09755 [Capronia epimyces CBS 606.96]EXJ77528.1 hypothetical protein A1O3_09755 [Capronia epimyces CBS 606.96]